MHMSCFLWIVPPLVICSRSATSCNTNESLIRTRTNVSTDKRGAKLTQLVRVNPWSEAGTFHLGLVAVSLGGPTQLGNPRHTLHHYNLAYRGQNMAYLVQIMGWKRCDLFTRPLLQGRKRIKFKGVKPDFSLRPQITQISVFVGLALGQTFLFDQLYKKNIYKLYKYIMKQHFKMHLDLVIII